MFFPLACLLALSSAIAQPIAPEDLALVKQAEQARIRTIEKVYNSVVAIYPRVRMGGGSGVIIDEDGFLLTNNHVMQPVGEEGQGGLADGKLHKLTLIGFDPGGDIAIARLHGRPRFDPAPLGDSGRLNVGDFCMAMGNPFMLAEDQRPTVTLGIVSGINRYQHGQGNIGVYGNCIQFDSSINPGNSGGPLFDSAGRLVGINGRGSFEERGRVNVGLGYAISIEQIKNFIPDLRAAKLCMHGTLDATFADRDGKVVCDEINPDAAIARLGMEMGDPILAIDGVRITGANQLAGLISTYPAKWPVEVAFEHKGVRKAVRLRLRPLPYQMPQRRTGPLPIPIRPGTLPATRPSGAGPATGPSTLPSTRPIVMPMMPPMIATTRPGDIRSMSLNREECERILRKWRAFSNEAKVIGDGKALEGTIEIRREGRKVGSFKEIRDARCRFRIELTEPAPAAPDGVAAFGCDGSVYWSKTASGKVQRDPEFRKRREVAMMLASGAFQQEKLPPSIKEMVLEGGDLAQRRRAYRLRVVDDAGNRMLFWFSVFADDNETFQVRMLKSAMESAGDDGDAMILADYRPIEGMMITHRFCPVKGLAEEVDAEMALTSSKVIDVPAGFFGAPDAPAK